MLTLLLLLSLPAHSAEIDVCDYYSEKSEEMKCDEKNYLTVFGLKYCRKFVEVDDQFSPEGKKTFHYIRHCLIDTLRDENGVTCENVRAKAEGHHVKCYDGSGYCDLKAHDKWVVFKKIWWELRSISFRRVIKQIDENCKK